MDPNFNLLLRKALAYTARQETCRWAVESKLKTWGASPDEVKSVVAYLEKNRYLDETRFASSFVSDMFRFNRWGKIKIAKALERKHIASSVFQPILDAMDQDIYMQTLTELLEKKAHEIEAKNKHEKQGKLISFALQRGFEYPLVERVLKANNNYETNMEITPIQDDGNS